METQSVHIKMDKELYDRIKNLADEDMRSLKATIQILLAKALESEEAQAKKPTCEVGLKLINREIVSQ